MTETEIATTAIGLIFIGIICLLVFRVPPHAERYDVQDEIPYDLDVNQGEDEDPFK